MKNITRSNSQKGYTLIELLMVVLIIGIMSVVVAPKFADLPADARNATAQATAGAISSASMVNFGAKMVGNTTAVAVNTATECTKPNLERFVIGATLNAGSSVAVAEAAAHDGSFDVLTTQTGVCTAASVAAGSMISCEIAARGGSKAIPVQLVCTGNY